MQFPTEEIAGARNLNFAPEFSHDGGFCPKFCVLVEHFLTIRKSPDKISCHLAFIILCALILSETLALYKSFTYLLT